MILARSLVSMTSKIPRELDGVKLTTVHLDGSAGGAPKPREIRGARSLVRHSSFPSTAVEPTGDLRAVLVTGAVYCLSSA